VFATSPPLCHSLPMPTADDIHNLPCWNGSISIEPLSGGLSNANYLVADSNGKHVVRFSVDYPFHHVFRDREVMTARAAHAAGFAPEVQYTAPGVMVTQFLGAKTFAAADVRANAARIGKLIRVFHLTMPKRVTGPGFIFHAFHVGRDYLYTLDMPDSEFSRHVEALEVQQPPLPIIFGHNDLLPGNFLDDGEKLWLIDFEYAGFGTCMFDLANASSNAQMNDDERQQLLTAYFGQKPSLEIQRGFSAMECASLLRETLWSMVSGKFLTTPGVDYNAYTAENLTRYNAALDRHQSQYGKLLI
jgi:thiamine kinase-like enzyme